ncbi:helix-turn-helix transcriptional regulator [Halopiger xanaduensis]|uniref:HTH iclR-type domain-containing protein n=1 Tax=Halopiger xanaduensis (strain DSM 18323 / JCM 14033 / SH-6) TaxID=797210 RepID=F8D9Y5_HALXS|nr:hypothetical protein [Halopiger xanaduensis]AEH35767.1 hypothetical protein Halxa_1133 [Halopiger xanaduensis SH-6]
MNGRVGVAVLVVAALLLSPGIGAAAADPTDGEPSLALSSGSAQADSESEPESGAETATWGIAQDQSRIDADEVRMDVAVQPNGTAEWTLEFWIRLNDEESRTAFDSLQSDIRDDPDNYTRSFADRMRTTVATASDATGREMRADGFAVETERRSFAREYGVVRYAFRWHGFVAVEDDGTVLRAGDAIEGLFLDDGTRLLLEWPAGYELESATPDPDERRERAVLWRGGQTDFITGEPQVVVTTGGPSTALVAAIAAVVIGLGAAGAWRYRDRLPTSGGRPSGGREPDAGSPSAAASDGASPTAASASTDDGSSSNTNSSDAETPSSEAAPESIPASDVDPELLSNEEQVLRLVRDRGGRMKQQAVVEELGWTDAKTSKVVSGLREDDALESFRIGRENVLALPDAVDHAAVNGGDADTDDS